MGPIGLRTRTWLRRRVGAALGLAAVVAVVGGVSLTLVGGAVRTATVVDRKLESIDFVGDVEVQSNDAEPDDDHLESFPAVADAEVATFFFGGVTPAGELAPADGITFVGTSLAPLTEDGLSAGRLPDGEDPGEFVATPSFAEQLDGEIGDHFDLITISADSARELGFDADPDGPVVPATLVGIIDDSLASLEDAIPLAYFDLSLLDGRDIGLSGGVALVDLVPGATADDLRAQLDEAGESQIYSLGPVEPVDDDVATAIDAQAQGIIVLAAIVGGASIVVLAQLLSRQLRLSLEEQTVLGAIGFTPGQLVLEPIARAAVVVGGGSALAAVLAFAASGIFPVGFSRRAEPHVGLRFDPVVHLAGTVVLALLVLGVLAILLAGQRDRRMTTRPSSTVERLVAAVPWTRPATALRFGFARGRRTGSTGASFAGLVLVVSLVVAAVTFGANFGRLLDEPARYGDIFDYGFGQGGDTIPDGVVETLEALPEVSGITLLGATTVSVGSDSLGLVAFEPVRGDVVPEVIEGRLPVADDEVALGTHAADNHDVEVGDDIELLGASGPQAMRVVGLAIVGAVEESDVTGQNGLVNLEGLQRLDPDEAMSTIGIDAAPDAGPGVRETISDAIGFEIGPTETSPNVVNLSRVRGVPFAVAVLVGLLTVLTLGHLLLVAVRRRSRDFAVLRSCGATSSWVGGVVQWQATLTTAFAVLVAVPIGVAAGSLLYRPYADGIGARIDTFVPFGWLLAGLLALLVLANAVAAVPARRIRRASPAYLLTRA